MPKDGGEAVTTLGIVSEDVVSIRAEASIGAESLATVEAGGAVVVWGVDGIWAHVSYMDIEGYTFAADLTTLHVTGAGTLDSNSAIAVRDAASITADVVVAAEPGTIAYQFDESDDGLFVFVMLETGETGWVFADSLVAFSAELTADRVLFRSGPEVSSDTIIRPLDLDDEITVVGVSANGAWYIVLVGDEMGYVSADFVENRCFCC